MYELWARSRETKIYRKMYIQNFDKKEMIDTEIDKINREKFKEVIVLETRGDFRSCTLERYEDFDNPKILQLKRN